MKKFRDVGDHYLKELGDQREQLSVTILLVLIWFIFMKDLSS